MIYLDSFEIIDRDIKDQQSCLLFANTSTHKSALGMLASKAGYFTVSKMRIVFPHRAISG